MHTHKKIELGWDKNPEVYNGKVFVINFGDDKVGLAICIGDKIVELGGNVCPVDDAIVDRPQWAYSVTDLTITDLCQMFGKLTQEGVFLHLQE